LPECLRDFLAHTVIRNFTGSLGIRIHSKAAVKSS
jgi:hypothetical protein